MIFNVNRGNLKTEKTLTYNNVNIDNGTGFMECYWLNSTTGGTSSASLKYTILEIGDIGFEPQKIKVETQDADGNKWFEIYDKNISDSYILRGYVGGDGIIKSCMRRGILYDEAAKTIKFIVNVSIKDTTVKVTCSN